MWRGGEVCRAVSEDLGGHMEEPGLCLQGCGEFRVGRSRKAVRCV